ncbi:3-isopropylmalate dehydratase [bacterium]|nr:MAG: 3-isopropylmalate dehydratase [bacterium]
MKPTSVTGKLWLITDENGKLISNIDTDMIFHNAHLAITKIEEMGKHAFGNLKGWEDFPAKCGKGDIVMVGKNFGSGSSRQQAVDCFASLGVSAIIAESYGSIYKRNAINSGMAIIEAPDLVNACPFQNGDTINVDFTTGKIASGSTKFDAKPMTEIQLNIYKAGSLFAYGKELVK